MTTDATTLLIQRITSQAGQPEAVNSQTSLAEFFGIVGAVVGIAANYAQLLSLFIPQEGQGAPSGGAAGAGAAGAGAASAASGGSAAVAAAGQAAQTSGSAGTAAGAAAAGAAGAAASASVPIAGLVIFLVSITIAILSEAIDGSDTGDAQASLQALMEAAMGAEAAAFGGYWASNKAAIASDWTAVYRDLSNLAAQGPYGPQINADQFICDAQTLTLNLVNTQPNLNTYWQRPYALNFIFQANFMRYDSHDLWGGVAMAWYGNLPVPQPLPGVDNPFVPDPNTMMPTLLWALQAYLSIEELAHLIDSSQYTFTQFLSHYRSGVPGSIDSFATFLAAQFALAIGSQDASYGPPTGLVKTDIPGTGDIAFWVMDNYYDQTGKLISQPFPASPPAVLWKGVIPSKGYGWNGVYGVADALAAYLSPANVVEGGANSGSFIIDGTNAENLAAQIDQATAPQGAAIYLLPASLLVVWIGPWLQNKVILGVMARWKALYLYRGYDKVWSLIQSLRCLAAKPGTVAIDPTPTLPDGTLADGNWSLRELCSVMVLESSAGWAIILGGLSSVDGAGYSVRRLVQALDTIAKGTFAGPAIDSPLAMPARFRDRLAAAAV
jgi:hypothetical protein